jgi:hypothetical protein
MDAFLAEELETYKAMWQRRYDIMKRQETDLSERIEYNGLKVHSDFYKLAESGALDRDDNNSEVMSEDRDEEKMQEDSSQETDQYWDSGDAVIGNEDFPVVNASTVKKIAKVQTVEPALIGLMTEEQERLSRNRADVKLEKQRKMVAEKKSYTWVERVIEVPIDEALLEILTAKAKLDPMVTEFDTNEDICPSLYPSSFETVVPKSVLKALRYAT